MDISIKYEFIYIYVCRGIREDLVGLKCGSGKVCGKGPQKWWGKWE